MSKVFVADDPSIGRRVVVKVLSPDLAAGVDVDRFKREIQLAVSLHHPRIVPVFSAGQSGDFVLYYTMPFIEGETLRALGGRGRNMRL
jgi:serine/threonine-protein kinase